MKTTVLSLIFSLQLSMLLPEQAKSQAGSGKLAFRENKGQVSDQFYSPRTDILFSGSDGKLNFYLKQNGVSYQLERVDSWKTENFLHHLPMHLREQKVPEQSTAYRIDVQWLNSNSNCSVRKEEALPGHENYYGESCPHGALDVKSYGSILYKDLYPGIDLKWFEKEGTLNYDFYVAANTDYRVIQIEYKGAEKIIVNKKGELVIQTPLGTITEQRPLVMQGNKKLEARWHVKNNIVSFDISQVDPAQAMIIDPMVRLWGTYYGGTGNDNGWSVNSDNAANVYITGWTVSNANIATTGAHQTTFGGFGNNTGDAFIAKFNLLGVRQWATYYGGSADDFGIYSTTDANGNVYMAGATSSTNAAVIATPGSHQSTAPGSTSNFSIHDAYLVKFNSSGVRQWGTYYGGSSYDFAAYVDVNANGDILLMGCTNSSDGSSIATPGSHQPVYGGGQEDSYIAVFNAAGVRQWSTYYGGNGTTYDEPKWAVFSASGDIYLSGYTDSPNDIATPGAHQSVLGGNYDGFLVKFNATGVRQWGTYYGGSGIEFFGRSAADASGNVYLNGNTFSASNAITTPGCHQSVFGGGTSDGVLAKFDPSGALLWGTYYGGTGNESANSTGIDPFGNIYLNGETTVASGTGIATACAYQPVYAGGSGDTYIQKFTPAGTRLWGTYFGSMYTDHCADLDVDIHGNLYILGSTLANSGTVMVTPGAHQATHNGLSDIFLQKFNGCIAGSVVNTTPPANLFLCAGNSTTLTTSCGNWYSSLTATNVLYTGDTFTTGVLTSDTTFYVEDFGCGSIVGARTPITVTIAPAPNITIVNSNSLACVGESITLTASGATTYSWTNNPVTGPVFQLYVLLQTTYTVNGVDANGCEANAMLTVVPNLCLGVSDQSSFSAQIISYPNPGGGSITIRSSSEVKLDLTNELGQTLQSIHLSASTNFETTLTDLANGVYYLKGEKGDHIRNQKIIVLH